MVNMVKQHTPIRSILLHLLPGTPILVSILLFSQPFVGKIFGMDARLNPVLGYLMSIMIGLIPVQLGILLFASRNEIGKYSIARIIQYTQRSTLKEYLLYVTAFILYFLFLFVVIAPIFQPGIVKTFFSWWPEKYNFQHILQNPSSVAGYDGINILIFLYILLSCILGPLVEEFYFRGYLLPRMEGYAGKWAPLLNTILFSLYHFFSPWENLIRIVSGYPLIYLVWKKRDIRFGILVHILVNTIGGVIASIILFSG